MNYIFIGHINDQFITEQSPKKYFIHKFLHYQYLSNI